MGADIDAPETTQAATANRAQQVAATDAAGLRHAAATPTPAGSATAANGMPAPPEATASRGVSEAATAHHGWLSASTTTPAARPAIAAHTTGATTIRTPVSNREPSRPATRSAPTGTHRVVATLRNTITAATRAMFRHDRGAGPSKSDHHLLALLMERILPARGGIGHPRASELAPSPGGR